MCILQMDLENAFNLQARARVFEGIRRYSPRHARYFRKLYGRPARLFNGAGDFVGHNSTGVRQGCPPAMLFFALGHHPTLEALATMVKEVKEEVGSTLPAGVSAYADDTSAFIGERGADLVARRAVDIIGATRMRVKLAMCRTFVHGGRVDRVQGVDGAEPCFRVIDDGVVVLGNPVGTAEYRRGKLSTLVSEMAKPLPTLTRVDPQSAYAMLQLCYNARPCYLARVSEPNLYWEAMGEFDAAIDAGIGGIARTAAAPMLPVLRSLPQRHGGLGLPRHQGTQSEKACLSIATGRNFSQGQTSGNRWW